MRGNSIAKVVKRKLAFDKAQAAAREEDEKRMAEMKKRFGRDDSGNPWEAARRRQAEREGLPWPPPPKEPEPEPEPDADASRATGRSDESRFSDETAALIDAVLGPAVGRERRQLLLQLQQQRLAEQTGPTFSRISRDTRRAHSAHDKDRQSLSPQRSQSPQRSLSPRRSRLDGVEISGWYPQAILSPEQAV